MNIVFSLYQSRRDFKWSAFGVRANLYGAKLTTLDMHNLVTEIYNANLHAAGGAKISCWFTIHRKIEGEGGGGGVKTSPFPLHPYVVGNANQALKKGEREK